MKAKTWDDECLSKMTIRNTEGDVALCVLWNLLDSVVATLPSVELPRLSVIGNLRTPLGISWFLRGLGELPHITTVVVWGSDLTRTGEALFALWEKGITVEHRVPDFGWEIDPLINLASIERFRREVQLVDARRLSLSELFNLLSNLSSREFVRQKVVFPPVELPEQRRAFSSRGGFVQLFARDPTDGWIKVLQLVGKYGSERHTRKLEVVSHLMDIKVVMPVPREERIKAPFEFSASDFEVYYGEFISSDPPPDGIDYRYGHRLQNWRNHDQLREVIARLRESPDTKRGSVVLLDPTDLEELEDAPCIALGIFFIRDETLHSSWVIRSNDMYSGWPFNILALLRVHRLVATELEISAQGFASFLSQNAQIYEHHFPTLQRNLELWGKKPEDFGEGSFFEPDPAGNFVFAVESGEVHVTMTNTAGDRILWEMSHFDPSALIGWLVETMPHLDPQHVRYLGREEEKLWRALKEGVPYIQG